MARKKGFKDSQASRNSNDGWVGFANIKLDEDDKRALQEGELPFGAAWEIVHTMLAEGHKLTLSLDTQRNNITASATGVRADCKNKGYTLTSFAPDIERALIVLAYKHVAKAGGVWSSIAETPDAADFG